MLDVLTIKNEILSLALQGNLTHGEDSDLSIEETYLMIKHEKEELISKKKARQDKTNNDFSSEPFEIPNRWKWIKFADVGLFKKGPFGSKLTKSIFVPKGEDTIKVYEQQHAINHDYNLGTYYITREYFDSEMSGFEVSAGDIIVSCAGTIGETYIMPEDIPRGVINQALMRITLVPSIDKEFFLLYFDYYLKKLAKDGNGVAITNIPPFEVLKNWLFPLLPLEEQKRIVSIVNEAFSILKTIHENSERFFGDREALKEKIVSLGISGKLIQTSVDWNDQELYRPIWSVTIWDKRFKNVKKGKQKQIKKYNYALATDLMEMEDLDGNVFLMSTGKYVGYTTEENAGDYLCEGEVVAIPWGGTPIVKYYKGKFVTSDNRIATSVDTNVLLNRFLYYYFIGNKKYLRSAYRGLGLEHPDMSKILDMEIPIPPIQEQQKIVEKLDDLMSAFDEL